VRLDAISTIRCYYNYQMVFQLLDVISIIFRIFSFIGFFFTTISLLLLLLFFYFLAECRIGAAVLMTTQNRNRH
jgi:hypothetical protein